MNLKFLALEASYKNLIKKENGGPIKTIKQYTDFRTNNKLKLLPVAFVVYSEIFEGSAKRFFSSTKELLMLSCFDTIAPVELKESKRQLSEKKFISLLNKPPEVSDIFKHEALIEKRKKFTNAISEGQRDPEALRAIIQGRPQTNAAPAFTGPVRITAWIPEYLAGTYEAGNDKRERLANLYKRIAPESIEGKLNKIKILKLYEKQFGEKVTFENVGFQFWKKFDAFMSAPVEKSKGKIVNYSAGMRNHTKTVIKAFFTYAKREGIRIAPDFDYGFKTEKVDRKEDFYLTLEEINAIATNKELEAPKYKFYRNARKILLIGCATGLRISDINRLKHENIDLNKGLIKILTKKTKKRVTIPILEEIYPFIREELTHLPKSETRQSLNPKFKVIASVCGLDRLVNYRKNVNGEYQREEKPINKVISTHICRASFITNAILEGIDIQFVKEIAGHSDKKTTEMYNRPLGEMVAERAKLAITENKYKRKKNAS